MTNYLKCNNCGYDMYGPEFISNAIDNSLFNSSGQHSDVSVLELSQKGTHNITCPFCNEKGAWSYQ